MYQNDLSGTTLELVMGRGSSAARITIDLILKAIIAYQKHHDKAIHHGEQTMKHFNESNLSSEWIKIDNRDIQAIRAALKRYHVDFHIEQDRSGATALFFRSKDHRLINYALEQVVKSAMEAEKYQGLEQEEPVQMESAELPEERPAERLPSGDRQPDEERKPVSLPDTISPKEQAPGYVLLDDKLREASDRFQAFVRQAAVLEEPYQEPAARIAEQLKEVTALLNQPGGEITPEVLHEADQKIEHILQEIQEEMSAIEAKIEKINSGQEDKLQEALVEGKLDIQQNDMEFCVVLLEGGEKELFRSKDRKDCEKFLDDLKPQMEKQIQKAAQIILESRILEPEITDSHDLEH